jgi:hypothetical protein
MLAHGLAAETSGRLVADGLATSGLVIVLAGDRPIEVIRPTITDAGRKALAG